ncbi:MAG: helix-turn-helix transcriptional regulator [bacterium]
MSSRRASSDPSVRVTLTPRQEEVLRMMAEGATNAQIAERLGLSLEGAKWHIREIFGRLGVDSREEAVAVWRHRRRRNPFGWIGALPVFGSLAAGAVVVVVVAAVALVAVRGGDTTHNAAAVPTVTVTSLATAVPNTAALGTSLAITPTAQRPQPTLKETAHGDGWRLLMADDGLALPGASEMVLAVGYETQPGRVDVLDRNGRVAARIEAGYAVMARVRPTTGEVLVSDWIGDPAVGTWRARVLVFDLMDSKLLAEIPLAQQRVDFTIPGNAIYTSNNGRWLYWVEHATVCSSGGDEAVCDQMIIRAVDLDAMAPADLEAKLPVGCGNPSVSIDAPPASASGPAGSGIVAKCLPREGGNRYRIAMDSFPSKMVLIGPGAPPRGWLSSYANGLALDPTLKANETVIEEVAVVVASTGAELAHWDVGEAWDAIILDGNAVLLLRPTGRLERIDIATGVRSELPFAIDAGAFSFDVRLWR